MRSNQLIDATNPLLLLPLIILGLTICTVAIYLLHLLGLSLSVALSFLNVGLMIFGLSVYRRHWQNQELDINNRRQLVQRASQALD